VIEVQDLTKHFGAVRALDGVTLSVAAGEVVCLIGPSGSGKSTLLRCINFLEEPTSGVVRVGGRRMGWEGERRASAKSGSAARSTHEHGSGPGSPVKPAGPRARTRSGPVRAPTAAPPMR